VPPFLYVLSCYLLPGGHEAEVIRRILFVSPAFDFAGLLFPGLVMVDGNAIVDGNAVDGNASISAFVLFDVCPMLGAS